MRTDHHHRVRRPGLAGLLATALIAASFTPVLEATPVDQLLVGEQLTNSEDRVLRFSFPDVELVNHAIPIGMSSLRTIGQMAIGYDGDLFVASTDAATVLRYDLRTGSRVGDGIFVSAGLGGIEDPSGLVFTNDGELLVASAGTDRIVRFDSGGNPVGIFASSSTSAISNLHELLVLPDGSVLASNHSPDAILRYASDGTPWGTDGTFISSESGLVDPRQMTLGPDGMLYVAVRRGNDGAVMRFNPSDGTLIDTFVAQDAGGLGNALGLGFGPDGDLYVSTTDGGGKINRYDGRFGFFLGIAADADVVAPETILFVAEPDEKCAADLDGDGVVNGADLGLLFVDWGPCN